MTLPPNSDISASSDVAAALSQLGCVVLSTETIDTVIELVTRLAVQTIPVTAGAGVTLVDDRGQRTTAASDPFVAEVDALQYVNNSGPCLSAWSDQAAVRIDDLNTEERWPLWTAAAAELGIRSMLSVPLLSVDRSVGAMKVYSRQPNSYDVHSEEVLGLFAEQASVLLANMLSLSDARRMSSQLSDALQTRDLIGQAKGVLMAQGARSDQEAFAMLVQASQRSNVKLHEVARQLIASVQGRNAGPQSNG